MLAILPTIQIKKFVHRDAIQIGFVYPYNREIKSSLKQLRELKYTKTHGCWYIPYSKVAWRAIKELKIPYTIIEQSGTTTALPPKRDTTDIVESSSTTLASASGDYKQANIANVANTNSRTKQVRNVRYHHKKFYVTIPYKQKDVEFLGNLKGAWWSKQYYNWVVKATLQNLEVLQGRFEFWDDETYSKLQTLIQISENPPKVSLFYNPEYRNKIMVKAEGYGVDVDFLKRIPDREYFKDQKIWTIPKDSNIVKRLLDHYRSQKTIVVDRLAKQSVNYHKTELSFGEQQRRALLKAKPSNRAVLEQLSNSMIQERYSWKSIQSYMGSFAKCIDYVGKPPEEITIEDVNGYIMEVSKKDVSDSLLNTIVSAAKFYFRTSTLETEAEIDRVKRPRKGKALPTILSIQEVEKMLRSSSNLKHTTVMYTMYSSGIRISELLAIKLSDIHWDRNQVLIHKGKGKKDRMLNLSETLKRILRLYFESYMPEYWLFEGQKKHNPYSSSSVQRVIKKAAKKAGISRKVTPHTLRHCYATHLLDSGTDIRYIQELLGHSNIKTTLIYTHVTNRSLKNVISPLDQIDVDFDKKEQL